MVGWRWLLGIFVAVCMVGCAEPVVDPSAEADSRPEDPGVAGTGSSAVQTAEHVAGSSTVPGPPAATPPSSPATGSVEARPPERTVNPFGAAGLINPADPLLAGPAGGAGGLPPSAAGGSFPAGSTNPPGYNAPPGSGALGVPPGYGPTSPGNPASAGDVPGDQTVRVPAQVGVGRRGRGLDQFQSGVQRVIAEPAKSLFAARERIVFNISIPHAMQLYQAEHGYLPRSHEEFMRDIIEANQIRLPELPAGHRYLYDPQRGELMVERPIR